MGGRQSSGCPLWRGNTLRALLDTNVVLWATLDPRLLTRAATAVLEDEANTLLVSAASAWEIATKVRIGKLDIAMRLEKHFVANIVKAGYTLVSLTPEIALRAGRLEGKHRDPFDRMIAAHALAEDIPVISADSALDCFGVRRIW